MLPWTWHNGHQWLLSHLPMDSLPLDASIATADSSGIMVNELHVSFE
jgi:hypothetical protein